MEWLSSWYCDGAYSFHVADLEEAKRFYVDGLGFEVTISS